MRITELGDGESEGPGVLVTAKAKRALVGVGARALFYPTLLYNVLRYNIQAEFRWWDEVDQFLLLGAVPFPKDVPRLRQLGVCGVVTLNEPYETLVPSSLYQAHGIDNLVIPTRDYLFAPSLLDICCAVEFIHKNASCGRTTYVHCKAGRGRSTTIVLCYLVKYKHMTPTAALEFVRLRRPRVLLAPSQWLAVQEFSMLNVDSPATWKWMLNYSTGDEVLVTEEDLEGYKTSEEPGAYLCVPSHSNFPSWSVDSSLVPMSSATLDAVFVTDADLEGYVDDNAACAVTNVSFRIVQSRPMISRLSCLFASLKLSSSCPQVASQLVEVRAC